MGAGKSTVSKLLADRGAVIVDSDRIAREVVEPGTPGLASLVEAFGTEILKDDGSLDRAALAAKAFGSDDARKQLNSITHPLIGQRTAELINSAPADAILVQDIPLLVEGGLAPLFNLVIVVWVDAEERVRRLMQYREIAEDDARARIAAQASDDQRRAVADVWLDNSGPVGSLDDEVARLWDERLVPFERNVREGNVVAPAQVVVPANPEWPRQAQRLIARLWVLSGEKAAAIHHVGPTALGDDAIDVIDLTITVADSSSSEALSQSLAAGGFPRADGVRRHGSADPGRPARLQLS
jgi:dephospho-CoA kinase